MGNHQTPSGVAFSLIAHGRSLLSTMRSMSEAIGGYRRTEMPAPSS